MGSEEMKTILCRIEGCDRMIHAKKLCASHYQKQYNLKETEDKSKQCKYEGCKRIHYAKGYCRKHYGIFQISKRKKSEYRPWAWPKGIPKEYLFDLHIKQEKSLAEMERILHVDRRNIKKEMRKYKIPVTKYISNIGKNCHLYGVHKFGKESSRWGKSVPVTKRISYKGIWMRSSWEIKIAKWLDRHNIKWLYESKRFELKDRTYAPDFYLPKKNIYWEVKGWFRKKDQETVRQFRQLYPNENLLVLTEPIYKATISQ